MVSFIRFFSCLIFLAFALATPALPELLTRPSDASIQDEAIIPLEDSGALIQDHVGSLVPNEIDTFTKNIASRIHEGQMVRLVIIQRHQDLGDDKLLGAFATRLFTQWGMSDLNNSVLVMYEAQSNKVVMRLGNEFAPMVRKRAFEALKTEYKPLLQQHKFNQAHQKGMLAVLNVFGKPPESTSLQQGADHPVPPQNISNAVRDEAGIFSIAGLEKLNGLVDAVEHPTIRILTTDSLTQPFTIGEFRKFAESTFAKWRPVGPVDTILIVHDVKMERIALAFGTKYSGKVQARIRGAVTKAYAAGLKQDLYNAAHFMGVEALINDYSALLSGYAPPTPKSIPQPVAEPVKRPVVVPAKRPVAEPVDTPSISYSAMAAFAIIAMIIAISAFMSQRKSTQGRRERASRISAWKQAQFGRPKQK